jgi:hypothetical protein
MNDDKQKLEIELVWNAIAAGTMRIATNVACDDAIACLMPSAAQCFEAWEQQELRTTAKLAICGAVAQAIEKRVPRLPIGFVIDVKVLEEPRE